MITIQKAIDDIELILKPGNAYLAADKPEALRLSIEALKEIQYLRTHRDVCFLEQLPGESTDP
ncbi:unnamed protein product [marine sediment metagenome]|uniref:Uncharacterized protein n=1 Tax=marine sediment metagenome TaxID=412755 RepID=X1NMX2_9ZZZZ